MNRNEPLIQLHFEGPSVERQSILWEDLSQFVTNLDLAIQRVMKVLETGSSVRTGRPTRGFQALTALEVVAMTGGSVRIGLNLRRDESLLPGFDAGLQAVRAVTTGLAELAGDGGDGSLPEGFDGGVLAALREAGRVLDRGIGVVHIVVTNGDSAALRAGYDKRTRQCIVSSIRKLEPGSMQVEGRLLMAELKEGGLRCRLHPSAGTPILCSFDEDLVPAIVSNLRRFVRVYGEGSIDPSTGRVHSLIVRDLESIEGPPMQGFSRAALSGFWSAKTFDELAMEQGVYPIEDWDQLVGNWPEDADFDSFLEAVRES